ncbi:MAG: type II toxin-antitoxin system prevent-host-death family antitoxin [Chloroflexi bacterium]|nr:type II toxin-antitoxin system prevent-host-death family antitoxin [Chloroflexota bacterium]
MARVGIRELKAKLSYYLDQVKQGEPVTITDRGTPVAVILPTPKSERERMLELVRLGLVTWSGGKPKGLNPRLVLEGKPLSKYILEGRD